MVFGLVPEKILTKNLLETYPERLPLSYKPKMKGTTFFTY
jgi:hypothetical protein